MSKKSESWRHFYLHVPFCRRKCGYCAFYSESGAPAERIDRYLEKLRADLRQAALTDPAETVYIGGGTPTLLSAAQLSELRAIVRDHLPTDADTEVTIESNPESLDDEKIGILSDFVTRLSVGVQSFDAGRRAALGRDCGDAAIDRALRRGREVFARLNCDLIYGAGDQTLEEWRGELRRAVSYGVDHLSCYELTPEENARLTLAAPPEELAVTMWHATGELLAAAGLPRYEISNYAREGCKSRHNRAVWRGERYWGFGPAAASFDGVKRWTQPEDLSAWLAGAAPEVDEIPAARREAEIFAVKLRTTRGWSHRACRRRFSAELLEKAEVLRRSCPEWFEPGGGVRLNERGLLFWNSIAEFLI